MAIWLLLSSGLMARFVEDCEEGVWREEMREAKTFSRVGRSESEFERLRLSSLLMLDLVEGRYCGLWFWVLMLSVGKLTIGSGFHLGASSILVWLSLEGKSTNGSVMHRFGAEASFRFFGSAKSISKSANALV